MRTGQLQAMDKLEERREKLRERAKSLHGKMKALFGKNMAAIEADYSATLMAELWETSQTIATYIEIMSEQNRLRDNVSPDDEPDLYSELDSELVHFEAALEDVKKVVSTIGLEAIKDGDSSEDGKGQKNGKGA